MIDSLILRRASYIAAAAFGVLLLKNYSNGGICTSQARIDGKVVIVTGGNGGIGKETVAELVRRGGKVYLACRSVERAKVAVEDIRKTTGASENQLNVLQLDLGSLESVRNFAKEFKKKENKLDILVNNAGIMESKYSQTPDGFEKTFDTNHLGPFLLTHLLTDRLLAPGSKSRVVNLSSNAHKRGVMNFDDLMSEKEFPSFSVYAQSKLANILFSHELSRRFGAAVSVYSVHPGVVRTNLFNEVIGQYTFPFLESLINGMLWPFTKEPRNGAQTSICCAVDEKLELETGKYYRPWFQKLRPAGPDYIVSFIVADLLPFDIVTCGPQPLLIFARSDCAEKLPYPQALDDQAAKRLWKVSLELVKLENSEIHLLLRDD